LPAPAEEKLYAHLGARRDVITRDAAAVVGGPRFRDLETTDQRRAWLSLFLDAPTQRLPLTRLAPHLAQRNAHGGFSVRVVAAIGMKRGSAYVAVFSAVPPGSLYGDAGRLRDAATVAVTARHGLGAPQRHPRWADPLPHVFEGVQPQQTQGGFVVVEVHRLLGHHVEASMGSESECVGWTVFRALQWHRFVCTLDT
jgi:hypothetical protein